MKLEFIKKLSEIYANLNSVEVKGLSNIHYLYQSIALLQQVMQSLENEKNSIKIDNTEGG